MVHGNTWKTDGIWTLYDWEKSSGQMTIKENLADLFRGGPPQVMTREQSTADMERTLCELKRVANEMRAKMYWAVSFQKPMLDWPDPKKEIMPSEWYNSFKYQTENIIRFAEDVIGFVKKYTPKGV